MTLGGMGIRHILLSPALAKERRQSVYKIHYTRLPSGLSQLMHILFKGDRARVIPLPQPRLTKLARGKSSPGLRFIPHHMNAEVLVERIAPADHFRIDGPEDFRQEQPRLGPRNLTARTSSRAQSEMIEALRVVIGKSRIVFAMIHRRSALQVEPTFTFRPGVSE